MRLGKRKSNGDKQSFLILEYLTTKSLRKITFIQVKISKIHVENQNCLLCKIPFWEFLMSLLIL